MSWRKVSKMIKLKKLEEPKILKENAKKWTTEYLECIGMGKAIPAKLKMKYSQRDIKAQLLKETNEKCVYCESKFTHICPGDIEHILPKNKNAHPELYVTWDNLTMACETCNRSGKRTYNNDDEPLLNPYVDEIECEIFSAGPMIFAVEGSRKGQISIDVLKLNRGALIERRIEAIKKVDLLRIQYEQEENEDYKNILLGQIDEEVGKNKEYSFTLKNFCSASGLEMSD